MRTYSREQLTVILCILIVACPFALIQLYAVPAAQETIYTSAPEAVYEVRGDVAREGFYHFARQQSIQSLVQAAGGLKQGSPSPFTDGPVIDSGKKVLVCADAANHLRWEITELDAAARINFFMPVQINRAAAEDLTLIPGIGPRTAEAIVVYRDAHHGISSVEELNTVPGIGEKKLNAILPYILIHD
jgi:competence protein ComEA